MLQQGQEYFDLKAVLVCVVVDSMILYLENIVH